MREIDSQLMDSILSNNMRATKFLIHCGANPNCIVNGMTSLEGAILNGSDKLISLLVHGGADVNGVPGYIQPLLVALYMEDQDSVNTLINLGAKTTITCPWGVTPLMLAAAFSFELVNTLLVHGSYVNAVDSSGRTALFFACLHKKADIVRILLNYGADKTILDDCGRSARDMCCMSLTGDNPEVDRICVMLTG